MTRHSTRDVRETRGSVLMVAYHFPPVRGSSGLQRTVSFARYLPGHGWRPLVLSASPRAYADKGPDQAGDIAPDLVVRRAFALDTARHLAIAGRYPGLLALPDRWVSWCLGAVPTGLAMIARYRPDVIWTTYPIATAHLIGLVLHRLTGIPWIADFRDSMTEENYPRDRRTWRVFRWIERQAVEHSALAVFTAGQALEMYAERYPRIPRPRLRVIENGYDEHAFTGLSATPPPQGRRPLKLLHSGILYPNERDPTALFDALAELRQHGEVGPEDLTVVFRGTGYDGPFTAMIEQRNIGDLVRLEPSLPYREALEEMLGSDALLIMQSRGCNHQIPAKLYEYYRARRPILALTHPEGDTAAALRRACVDRIVDMTDREQIARALKELLGDLREGTAGSVSEAAIDGARRESRTGELSALLDEVVAR